MLYTNLLCINIYKNNFYIIRILRLKEVGLWKAIMERWWIWKVNEIDDIDTPDAIVIQQVSLVIAVMFCGLITAFIIFIIENIVFVYKIKQS